MDELDSFHRAQLLKNPSWSQKTPRVTAEVVPLKSLRLSSTTRESNHNARSSLAACLNLTPSRARWGANLRSPAAKTKKRGDEEVGVHRSGDEETEKARVAEGGIVDGDRGE